MEMSEVLKFDQPKVGTIKLSEAVRQAGYGDRYSYNDCVLGRAYRVLTGRSLLDDGYRSGKHDDVSSSYVRHAADTFGIPYRVAQYAEWKCFAMETPEQIADWLGGMGL